MQRAVFSVELCYTAPPLTCTLLLQHRRGLDCCHITAPALKGSRPSCGPPASFRDAAGGELNCTKGRTGHKPQSPVAQRPVSLNAGTERPEGKTTVLLKETPSASEKVCKCEIGNPLESTVDVFLKIWLNQRFVCAKRKTLGKQKQKQQLVIMVTDGGVYL